nr:hypothetical protein GCM10017745_71520 [Saccharothrix mutabilis subsp. capreolus]
MRCGIVLPFFDAADVAECAARAEATGWDGVFLAESVWGVDAWVALTAAAMRTSKLVLGTMLTPLPRVKPWDLASKVGTLDRLSGGRVRLAVGLGAPHPGWTAFEPDQGRAERALLLEEGLAVYDGLMRGQPFSFSGKRYSVGPTDFFPRRRPCSAPACRCGWWARTRAGCRCGGRRGGTGCCPTSSRPARRRGARRARRNWRRSSRWSGRCGRPKACRGRVTTWWRRA